MPSSFGSKIAEIREKEGMKQETLAALLGIDKTTLSRYETGVIKDPPFSVLPKLSEVFEISSDYFTTEIPLEVQRDLDTQRDLTYQLLCLPEKSIEHYSKMIDLEYNEIVLQKAKKPLREKYPVLGGKNISKQRIAKLKSINIY